MREPGRIRWRLAARLLEVGLQVSPYDLWCQEGGYRGPHWDLARWGSYAAVWIGARAEKLKLPPAFKIHIYSWDTMTDCARYGVVLHYDPLAADWHMNPDRNSGVQLSQKEQE